MQEVKTYYQRHKFNFDTIEDFDKHISNSIYGYDLLHKLIVNISTFFIKEDELSVIDLGCTTGKLAAEIAAANDVNVTGFDITDSNFFRMNDGRVSLEIADITDDAFSLNSANLITCIFTLQFIPIIERTKLLAKIYDALTVNGALILCEKEICESGTIQEVFTFANYENKRNNFSTEEILDKEKSLRSVMNCVSQKTNIELIKGAGFQVYEVFFKSLNFTGYICKK